MRFLLDRWRINVAGLLVMLLVTGLVAAAFAYAATEQFFVKDAPKNAVLGQMANQPQAVMSGNYTYVAYQGIDYDPYVVRYSHTAGVWGTPVRAGDNPLKNDNHGAPALFIDDGGYIHIYFGSHHDPLLHRRTNAPAAISNWIDQPSIGTQTTYPQVVRAGTPKVPMLFYREQSGGTRWELRPAVDASPSVEATTVLLSDYPLDMYPSFRESTGADDRVHVAWVEVNWKEYIDDKKWGRHNLYYMERHADGLWRNAASEVVTLPVTPDVADASCLVTDTAEAYTNLPVSGVDGLGRPAILYTTGYGTGPASYTYRFAVWTGIEWSFSVVCNTDHFFDSGTWRLEDDGTITAFIETGLTDGTGRDGIYYDDLGGSIHRFTSSDNGASWSDEGSIDPGEQYDLYHNAHLVTGGDGRAQVMFQQWNNEPSIEAFGLYMWGDEGLLGRQFVPEVTRYAGRDRYQTAADIARKGFPQGTGTVVIASGEVFSDAMVSAPLAKTLGAPIVLVRKDSLPSASKSVIRTLGARTAVIVGGPNTISAEVETALGGAGINQIDRIFGRDRYNTAKAVALDLASIAGTPTVAYVSSGEKWPDGLSVGALAALQGAPLLLTQQSRVQDPTLQVLASFDVSDTVVVGGPLSVSEDVYNTLGATHRIGGRDRYAVAANIAEYGMTRGFLPRRAVAATGRDYPDSLTSSVLAARVRGPVLLVSPTVLPDTAAQHLSSYADKRLDVWVCGGEMSVGSDVFAAIKAAIGAP